MIAKVKGPTCPLSNFYMHPIPFDSNTFPSAEHLYQFLNASFHNRQDVARLILAPDAFQVKKTAKLVHPSQQWQDLRAVLMFHILQLKFLACPAFRQDLQAASGFIDHCIPDLFWGTGPPGTFGSNVFGLLLTTLKQSVRKL